MFGDNGLAPVKVNKLWGFINTSGVMVLPAEYVISVGATLNFKSMLADKGFIDGVARVRKGKDWGYINEKGEPIGGHWYQNAEVFSK
ncbi:MAG: WG repeat-containing protein [Flavobacteriales bacterium]|nr:WG repeat-containing protein [Flavobacteriales bacterium]